MKVFAFLILISLSVFAQEDEESVGGAGGGTFRTKATKKILSRSPSSESKSKDEEEEKEVTLEDCSKKKWDVLEIDQKIKKGKLCVTYVCAAKVSDVDNKEKRLKIKTCTEIAEIDRDSEKSHKQAKKYCRDEGFKVGKKQLEDEDKEDSKKVCGIQFCMYDIDKVNEQLKEENFDFPELAAMSFCNEKEARTPSSNESPEYKAFQPPIEKQSTPIILRGKDNHNGKWESAIDQ